LSIGTPPLRWSPNGCPLASVLGYATGICFIAAGLAILAGIKGRLAAILLTVMIASFALLVNEPMLLANPASHFNWTESAVNLAILGAAWVVADSLALPRSSDL
jgi:uncharacterized membrane protein YphA (DoxX/SURF4 family)